MLEAPVAKPSDSLLIKTTLNGCQYTTLVNATVPQDGLAIALATLFSAGSSMLFQRLKARLTFISIYGIAFLNTGVRCTALFI